MVAAKDPAIVLARTRKQRKYLKRKRMRFHTILRLAERVSDVLVSIFFFFLGFCSEHRCKEERCEGQEAERKIKCHSTSDEVLASET